MSYSVVSGQELITSSVTAQRQGIKEKQRTKVMVLISSWNPVFISYSFLNDHKMWPKHLTPNQGFKGYNKTNLKTINKQAISDQPTELLIVLKQVSPYISMQQLKRFVMMPPLGYMFNPEILLWKVKNLRWVTSQSLLFTLLNFAVWLFKERELNDSTHSLYVRTRLKMHISILWWLFISVDGNAELMILNSFI